MLFRCSLKAYLLVIFLLCLAQQGMHITCDYSLWLFRKCVKTYDYLMFIFLYLCILNYDNMSCVCKDPTRLHYEPWELQSFENIECQWPMFFCYLVMDGLFRGRKEQVINGSYDYAWWNCSRSTQLASIIFHTHCGLITCLAAYFGKSGYNMLLSCNTDGEVK